MNSEIFYNKTAISSGRLTAFCWRIPYQTDWKRLKAYLLNNASCLKTPIYWGDECEATNKACFDAFPTGLFTKEVDNDKSVYTFENLYSAYWSMDFDQQTVSEKAVLLKFNNDEINDAIYSAYSGYSVRCIRE